MAAEDRLIELPLASHVWRQDHNGFTHQDPGFIDHVVNKKAEVVRVYLPPDANCLLSVMDHCLRSRHYVNVVIAGKHPAPEWLTMDAAIKHCTEGIGIWQWASNDQGVAPDVVMACCGDVPTLETLAAVSIMREHLPDLKIRVVNVVDLMKLQPQTEHPHGLSDVDFDDLFNVTNGVHTPSWDSAEADELWTTTCGAERWRGTMETVAQDVARASDEDLWALRVAAHKALVAYVRERMASHVAAWGAAPDEAAALGACLDPDALTLGFARRFATYKRPNMLLHDTARLLRLLSSRDDPVQLVIAGKAHPADQSGQDMIKEWIQFARRPETRGRVIFLPDYDLLAAEHLVQGVDLWINTPRRPWEASGTSGMKVLVNGGLNLSELDGWWAEAYSPDVGWALGDGCEHGDDPAWDAAEAEALYGLLEREVVPAFLRATRGGFPPGGSRRCGRVWRG